MGIYKILSAGKVIWFRECAEPDAEAAFALVSAALAAIDPHLAEQLILERPKPEAIAEDTPAA